MTTSEDSVATGSSSSLGLLRLLHLLSKYEVNLRNGLSEEYDYQGRSHMLLASAGRIIPLCLGVVISADSTF